MPPCTAPCFQEEQRGRNGTAAGNANNKKKAHRCEEVGGRKKRKGGARETNTVEFTRVLTGFVLKEVTPRGACSFLRCSFGRRRVSLRSLVAMGTDVRASERALPRGEGRVGLLVAMDYPSPRTLHPCGRLRMKVPDAHSGISIMGAAPPPLLHIFLAVSRLTRTTSRGDPSS